MECKLLESEALYYSLTMNKIPLKYSFFEENINARYSIFDPNYSDRKRGKKSYEDC